MGTSLAKDVDADEAAAESFDAAIEETDDCTAGIAVSKYALLAL